MAVTPDTTIKLLKVPIEIDNLNQLTFATKTAQYNYFNSLPSIEEEDLYYQRKDNFISFPAHIDSILEYNYCMYQNSNYSNKWFYAFITRMEYENDGMTRVYIETDTFQTWQFDIEYKASFVEREHVNDDTIGSNLIPENLQLGEYTINSLLKYPRNLPATEHSPNITYIIGVTETYDNTTNTWSKVDGQVYDGTFYPYKFLAVNNIGQGGGVSDLKFIINWYNNAAKESAIVCIFILPSLFVNHNGAIDPLKREVTSSTVPFSEIINENHTSIELTNASLDGYVPVNNKLKTYPYSFLSLNNNAGSSAIYRYENFYTEVNNEKTLIPSPSFKIRSTITPSGSARIIPLNYKGEEENELEGLNMGKYPILRLA